MGDSTTYNPGTGVPPPGPQTVPGQLPAAGGGHPVPTTAVAIVYVKTTAASVKIIVDSSYVASVVTGSVATVLGVRVKANIAGKTAKITIDSRFTKWKVIMLKTGLMQKQTDPPPPKHYPN